MCALWNQPWYQCQAQHTGAYNCGQSGTQPTTSHNHSTISFRTIGNPVDIYPGVDFADSDTSISQQTGELTHSFDESRHFTGG